MKTASPLIFVLAPKLFPWKIGPSLIVKVARSKLGLVLRVDVRPVELRGVGDTISALPRTWKVILIALLTDDEVGLRAAERKRFGNILAGGYG